LSLKSIFRNHVFLGFSTPMKQTKTTANTRAPGKRHTQALEPIGGQVAPLQAQIPERALRRTQQVNKDRGSHHANLVAPKVEIGKMVRTGYERRDRFCCTQLSILDASDECSSGGAPQHAYMK
jgi:hypothetical protein